MASFAEVRLIAVARSPRPHAGSSASDCHFKDRRQQLLVRLRPDTFWRSHAALFIQSGLPIRRVGGCKARRVHAAPESRPAALAGVHAGQGNMEGKRQKGDKELA